ncbi:MAG: tetratricopeptide repeat protein [Planctomycetota bacterium]|nr:tetratricopeptide repeat protein [Planctomycetota bacterium]
MNRVRNRSQPVIPRSPQRGVAMCALIAAVVSSIGCAWMRDETKGPIAESRWFVAQARFAEQQGNNAQAISLLTEAIQRNPKDVESQRWLGELLVEQGRSREAARHLSAVARQNPDDPQALVQLSRVWLQQDSPDEARPLLIRAIEINPHDVEALLMLAELESKAERLDATLDLYHRALETDAANVFAQFGIARAHLQRREPDRAAPLLRALTHRNDLTPTQQSDARWLLGIAYGSHRRWLDAAQNLELAVGNNPVVGSDVWYRIAYAYHQGSDLLNAERMARIALKRNPTDKNALVLWQRLRPGGDSAGDVMQAGHQITEEKLAVPEGW